MEDWTLAWWIWLVLGIFLLAVELQAGTGFYLLFFAVGALVVGLLAALNLAVQGWVQWLLFSAVSVAALLLFRQRLVERLREKSQPPAMDTLVGETAMPLQDIAVDAIGRVELRGTVWSARNASGQPLAAGDRCVVERVEGLMLWVRGEGRGALEP